MNNNFYLNSYNQGIVSGQADMAVQSNNLLQGMILGSGFCGQPVRLAAGTSHLPIFIPITNSTVQPFGIITYDRKQSTFKSGQRIGVSFMNACVYMQAISPVIAGTNVMYVHEGQGIAPLADNCASIGIALASATEGQLIRVLLSTPYNLSTSIQPGSVVEERTRYVNTPDWEPIYSSAGRSSGFGVMATQLIGYTTTISIAGTNIGGDFNPSFISSDGQILNMSYELDAATEIITVTSNEPKSGTIAILG